MRLRILLACLLWVGSGVPAVAQVAQMGFAFRISEVRPVPGGRFLYRYELHNRGERGEVLTHVLVDLSTPRTFRAPEILRKDKGFLFDALAEHPNAEYSHPPVGIAGPDNWYSSIYYTAAVSWNASRRGEGGGYGAKPGQVVKGFELESPAVPAYRQFRVLPDRPYSSIDDPNLEAVDSTFVLREGYVVAPGRMAADIDGEYLLEQIEGACYFQSLTDCERYRGLARRIVVAEEAGDQGIAAGHIRRLQGMLIADPAASNASKTVIGFTLKALSERKFSSK